MAKIGEAVLYHTQNGDNKATAAIVTSVQPEHDDLEETVGLFVMLDASSSPLAYQMYGKCFDVGGVPFGYGVNNWSYEETDPSIKEEKSK